MRVLGIVVVALMMCGLCAFGQSAAPVTITVVQDSNGHLRWAATNTGTVTITALALAHEVTVKVGSQIRTATAIRTLDAATEPLAVKPIPPGQTVALSFGPANTSQPLPQARAVVFAGGTDWGDPHSVQRITQRRASMKRHLIDSITDLMDALKRGTGRAALASEFQFALDRENAASRDADDRSCIQATRGLALKNLREANPGASAEGVIIPQLRSLRSRLGSALAIAPE